MPNVTIRNVPPEVHAVLARRAMARGQSLQQYLLHLLEQQAATPTTDEWLQQVEQGLEGTHAAGGWDTAELIRSAREERSARVIGD